MDGGLGAALDTSATGASSLHVYVAELANQGSMAAVAITVALLLIMVLVQLVKPAGSDAAVVPSLVAATSQAVPASASTQRVAVAVGPRPTEPWSDGIPLGSGLSAMDVVALTALRRRIQSGEVAEGPTGPERLAFARWLAEHGQLDG